MCVGALALAVVVPAVRAHSLATPVNTSTPSIVVVPGQGSHVNVTQGSWGGNPTSFSYQYLRCPGGGGPSDGSLCTPIGPPTPVPTMLVTTPADSGHSLRVRVTATNAGGSTSVLSAPSATGFTSDINVLGCPPVQQAGATVEELRPPARLEFDRHTNSPAVITRSTRRLTLRIEVVACDDQAVRGAVVYATPTPFQMFSNAEGTTDATGWVTLTMRRQRHFPATPRQQNFIVFVRATRPGDPLLGGISTRQLISLRVRLG
jgi:hypothetical protein